mgnify:CR=1 FL=1
MKETFGASMTGGATGAAWWTGALWKSVTMPDALSASVSSGLPLVALSS